MEKNSRLDSINSLLAVCKVGVNEAKQLVKSIEKEQNRLQKLRLKELAKTKKK